MVENRFLIRMLRALAFFSILLPGIGFAQGFDDRHDRIVAETFEPNRGAVVDPAAPTLLLQGTTIDDGGITGAALRLSSGNYATIDAVDAISTRDGTILFWVKPNANSVGTQTYIAMRWADQLPGYLAISQGWWEPIGQDRLYFILSNTRSIHCSVKYTLPPNKWSQIVATWASGQNGYCALYVNSDPLAHHQAPYAGDQISGGPIYIGSDAPTTEARGRGANALIDDLVILRNPLSYSEVVKAYESAKATYTGRDEIAGPWVEEAMPSRKRIGNDAAAAPVAETRAIFHEGIEWALSRKSTDEIISRVATSGFNVYIPCVWYVTGARFPTETAPADPRLFERFSRDDPLAYLIERAHAVGIEVHACLTIAIRGSGLFPQFAGKGTPDGAYDLHDPQFRKKMVRIVSDVVQRYPVDGINLDYIRTMGVCKSGSCVEDYQRRFGRSLTADLAASKTDPGAATRIAEWNLAAVTEIVRGVSAAVRAIRPGVVISVDAHPNNPDLLRQGQDSVRWANDGLVDVVYDMSYGRIIDIENIAKVREMLDQPSRLSVMLAKYDRDEAGSTDRPAVLLEKYIELVRNRWPDMGLGIYNYPLSDEQAMAFSTRIFMPRLPPSCPKDWGHLCLSRGVVEPRASTAPQ